jgi:molybdate transport system substrate-binding protein
MGALDTIARSNRRTTGVPVRVVYGPGSVLIEMLGTGSNADILFTADPMVMEHAVKSGAVKAASKVDLLASRLVLVRPRFGPDQYPIVGDGMQLSDFLGKDGKLAMCDPQVAEGRAGIASLRAMNLWDGVSTRTVFTRTVQDAVSFVSGRNALLGIVFDTDAARDPGVETVGVFPDGSHPPIRYSFALTPAASPAAAAFAEYLKGKDAATKFRDLGYTVIGQQI